MNPSLRAVFEQQKQSIDAICESYSVASLDLFGSGTTDAWRPDESDLDFVVTFLPTGHEGLADRYLGLAEELEALFQRSVDLITPGAIKNPYFRARVDASRSRIYAK